MKNPGEKRSAPLVQSSVGKYSFQVKIFEFYLSGPKCRGGTLQSANPALWNSVPVVRKIFLCDFFTSFVVKKYRIRIFGHKVAKTCKLVQSSEGKYSLSKFLNFIYQGTYR